MALRIYRLFVELNRLGTTVLIATHDQDLVARSGTPVLHLDGGRLDRCRRRDRSDMSERPFDPARWRPAPFLPEQDAPRPGADLRGRRAVLPGLPDGARRASPPTAPPAAGPASSRPRPPSSSGPRGGETPDAAAARAAEVLAGVPGVTEARALEKEKADALIAPLAGRRRPTSTTCRCRAWWPSSLDPEAPATAATLSRGAEGPGPGRRRRRPLRLDQGHPPRRRRRALAGRRRLPADRRGGRRGHRLRHPRRASRRAATWSRCCT